MRLLLLITIFSSCLLSYGHSVELCNRLLSSGVRIQMLSPSELDLHVEKSLKKVSEFNFIKQQAERLGLRVWLFGGTASSFLHYTKWDLLRTRGQLDLQSDRFDFDFTNIFRSTQDLDVVVDAPPEVAKHFEKVLKEKFPHFLGNKANKWEVRTLNHAMGFPGVPGFKEALLNDEDFNNQNTDSNSVGMVEITDSESPRITDLKSWNKVQSIFLEDAVNNRISYFRNDKHFETARAQLGENPEILSALRLLVKSFQYELSFSNEVFEVLKEISKKFDPYQIENEIARYKIAETSKKLVMHAVNIEYAMNVLDELGLRKKLIEMGNKNKEEDFSWWLNKEPLRSKSVGSGTGRTAKALGIGIVAHETNSFLAYESITRAHNGEPNVLISRQFELGEQALYGDGFYTRIGREGARNTGITIRFEVHPDARENTDFILTGDSLIFLNKKALSVIPESLNLNLEDLYEMAISGVNFDIDDSDLALMEKLKRRLNFSVVKDDFERLLNSDKKEDLLKLTKILNVLYSSRFLEIVSKELVLETTFKVLKQVEPLSMSKNEEDVLSFIITLAPILKILHANDLISKYDFLSFLEEFLKSDAKFEYRLEAFLEFSFYHDEIIEGIGFLTFPTFFSKNEMEKIKTSIDTIWVSSSDERKIKFVLRSQEIWSKAIESGSVDEVKFLISGWFFDINYKNISEVSLLQLAAYYEQDKIIEWLLTEEEFDFFAENSLGQSEITQLRLSGKEELARDILARLKERENEELGSQKLEKKWWQRIFSKNLLKKEEAPQQVDDPVEEVKSVETELSHPVVDFIEFKEGTFLMNPIRDEKVLTSLTHSFEVMSVDVTQEVYAKVVELMRINLKNESLNPYPSEYKGVKKPVEQVSYYDVVHWISGLNELAKIDDEEVKKTLIDLFPGHEAGFLYDLPTEAQWEYVARLGGMAEGEYSFGNDKSITDEYSVFYDSKQGTKDVGSKKPVFYNGQPLYDLHGLVYRWVKDWLNDLDKVRITGGPDPQGPLTGTQKIIRGGAFWESYAGVSSGSRSFLGPNSRTDYIGFRLIRIKKQN